MDQLPEAILAAHKIVVVQPDNPDGDSLGSSIALESILTALGKEVTMVCKTDMSQHLRYLTGWSRVQKQLPKDFDASIIVDGSAKVLFVKWQEDRELEPLLAKPHVILDHHRDVSEAVTIPENIVFEDVGATGEMVFELAKNSNWKIPLEAAEAMMVSILSDTLGLSTPSATATTYRRIAELIDLGVDRAALEDRRRELSKMSPDIFRYKGQLITKTEFFAEGRLALVCIPNNEIRTYSPHYNPGPLILGDILNTEGVQAGIVLKIYDDKHVTGSIRTANNTPVASEIAEAFGGGGHIYAAGFRLEKVHDLAELKSKLVQKATSLLK